MLRRFTHTAEALKQYDATQEERDALWETAQSDADVLAAEAADTAAQEAVGEAFYLDTSDINTRENCLRVPLSFARRMVTESAK